MIRNLQKFATSLLFIFIALVAYKVISSWNIQFFNSFNEIDPTEKISYWESPLNTLIIGTDHFYTDHPRIIIDGMGRLNYLIEGLLLIVLLT